MTNAAASPQRDLFSIVYPIERRRAESGGKPRLLRLPRPNILTLGKHGLFVVNCLDIFIGQSFLFYGEFSELESEFLLSLLQPGDNVIEVGSNIGAHTVALSKAVKPGGTVLAIEPQPQIFRTLSTNLELNALRNVKSFNVGCGTKAEQLYLPEIDYDQLGNFGGIMLQKGSGAHKVEVVPLDSLAEECAPVKLLKIDAEGMENEILRGSRKLIKRDRPLLYVENDRKDRSAQLIEQIRSLRYKLFWHRPPLFNPRNFFGVEENILVVKSTRTRLVSTNMFCVPEESSSVPSEEYLQRWKMWPVP